MMDYSCDKYVDCSFSRFGSTARRDVNTYTDADECFTPATPVAIRRKHTVTIQFSLQGQIYT